MRKMYTYIYLEMKNEEHKFIYYQKQIWGNFQQMGLNVYGNKDKSQNTVSS